MTDAPPGSNADEWELFLEEWGTAYCAVRIAEALEAAREEGRRQALEEALNKVSGCDRVTEVGPAIRALIDTPPAPVSVQEAARVLLMHHEGVGRSAVYDACANRVKVYKFDAVLRALAQKEGE